jgi:hypothetical protein
MSEPVIDPTEYYKMTEDWLSQRDLRDPAAHVTTRGAEQQPGPQQSPVALHEPAEPDDYPDAEPADFDDPAEFDDDEALFSPEYDAVDDTVDTDPFGASRDIGTAAPTVDDDTPAADDPADDDAPPASNGSPPRFNKRIAAGFAAATVAATVLAAGAMLAMRSEPRTADVDHLAPAPGRTSGTAAAPTSTAAVDGTDPPIAYTATAVGCLPGSTAAQSAAGADPTQALVCVTGGNIGQYVRLNLGRTMVITAACVASGWVGKDASGADQWHQHGVLTRVQWTFNDSPPTVVPKDTDSVHGDACQPMPNHGVLASQVLMLIQGVGRAPADTAPATPAPGGPGADGGPLGQIFGPPAEPTPSSDPAAPADHSHTDAADNTWATSSIKLFGHPPQ